MPSYIHSFQGNVPSNYVPYGTCPGDVSASPSSCVSEETISSVPVRHRFEPRAVLSAPHTAAVELYLELP